ncbi:hypothetical protein CcCBS67573_g02285 [Chytriomyces confervae]|uniref:Uncharacterized protein n=1 Tax=Chytriomyces confervae TaxID=246404 RepID=A0A507FJE3_9FUNG|nr:hypothetical protein HDU80_004956 [Chytriomyces hyalinus]TPX76434.1 hypothetical protein CcCBS67573_g02285 [Chytriomyces confervae]
MIHNEGADKSTAGIDAAMHSPWVAIDAKVSGKDATLLVKSTFGTDTSHAYAVVAALANEPLRVYSETLSLDEIASRVAAVAPAYRRNSPTALVAHIRKLLVAQHPLFTYTITTTSNASPDALSLSHSDSQTEPDTLSLQIEGSINGLRFAWLLVLKSLSYPQSASFISTSLIAPFLATSAALLAHRAVLEKAIAERDNEIASLRALVASSGGEKGLKIKKSAPIQSDHILMDSIHRVLKDSSAKPSLDLIGKNLFRRSDLDPLYSNIMNQLAPRAAPVETRENADDDVELDYCNEELGSTQRAGPRATGGPSSQAIVSPQKSKKEDVADMAEKRLQELVQLGEKKVSQANAKPKKRKII